MENAQDAHSAHGVTGVLTPADVARAAGVSASTVRRRGTELGRKVFGRWHLDPEKVDAALAGQAGAR